MKNSNDAESEPESYSSSDSADNDDDSDYNEEEETKSRKRKRPLSTRRVTRASKQVKISHEIENENENDNNDDLVEGNKRTDESVIDLAQSVDGERKEQIEKSKPKSQPVKKRKKSRKNKNGVNKLLKSSTLSLLKPVKHGVHGKGGQVENENRFANTYGEMKLKKDHNQRPIWVLPTGQILLESSSKFYKQAYDFLVAIAEPVSRPRYVHEYQLTPYSLFAAVSINLDVNTILSVMEKLSKGPVPENVKKFIVECTMNFGKAKLVLKENRMYVEAADVRTLDTLLADNVISAAHIPNTVPDNSNSTNAGKQNPTESSRFEVSAAAIEHRTSLEQYNLIEIDENGLESEFDTDIAFLTSLQAPQVKTVASTIEPKEAQAANPSKDGEKKLNQETINTSNNEEKAFCETSDRLEAEGINSSLESKTEAAPKITDNSNKDSSLQGITSSTDAKAETPPGLTVDSAKNAIPVEENISIVSKTKPNEDGKDKPEKCVYSFEILPSEVEHVQRAALKLEYPLMNEYDFRRDTINESLQIEMKATTNIRPYQSKSLTKMFGNGRARSGLIVLPCGAGKTLTGILAACTIKKSCIVLCSSVVAVKQWKQQFTQFTTIKPERICCFSSKDKDELPLNGTCVLLTTYSMMAAAGKRSEETVAMLEAIASQEWGLLILDEVHVVPAKLFRRVLTRVKAHCKLGLTATLVREDNLILDLNFLIGPKLYEANWLDLTKDGYIANVLCSEVWCPMTAEFFAEYLEEENRNTRHLLYVLNPNKCLACDYLVKHHEARGDKILIFCDNVFAIELLHALLKRPYIYGKTPEKERIQKISQFRKSHVSNTLIISKVGDVAIDLPEATVLIQVSSHFGSRRQEAQRLGRILRPKSGNHIRKLDEDDDENYNAFFYSLISSDTKEAYYSSKRQRYLVNNGYTFRAVTNLSEIALASAQSDPLLLNNGVTKLAMKDQQLALLSKILSSGKGSSSLIENYSTSGSSSDGGGSSKSESESESESEDDEDDDGKGTKARDESESDSDSDVAPVARPTVQRSTRNVAALSGAGTLEYSEYKRGEGQK